MSMLNRSLREVVRPIANPRYQSDSPRVIAGTHGDPFRRIEVLTVRRIAR